MSFCFSGKAGAGTEGQEETKGKRKEGEIEG